MNTKDDLTCDRPGCEVTYRKGHMVMTGRSYEDLRGTQVPIVRIYCSRLCASAHVNIEGAK